MAQTKAPEAALDVGVVVTVVVVVDVAVVLFVDVSEVVVVRLVVRVLVGVVFGVVVAQTAKSSDKGSGGNDAVAASHVPDPGPSSRRAGCSARVACSISTHAAAGVLPLRYIHDEQCSRHKSLSGM